MIAISRQAIARPPSHTIGDGLKQRDSGRCMPRLLDFGGTVVVVLVNGGMAGSVAFLLLEIGSLWSVVIGFVWGIGVALTIYSRRDNSNIMPTVDLGEFHNYIDIVTIDNIVLARPVDGLEDFGPGYVVETAEGDQIYFTGQIVEEIDNDGEWLNESIVLHVGSESLDVIKVESHGKPLEISAFGVPFRSLPIDPAVGFKILSGHQNTGIAER